MPLTPALYRGRGEKSLSSPPDPRDEVCNDPGKPPILIEHPETRASFTTRPHDEMPVIEGELPLWAGTEPVPGYVLDRRVGRGGYGEVWRASGPGGVTVAMKFIRLGEQLGEVELRSLDLIGIPTESLFEYMREAAKGIDYLNTIPIAHRDIKPQNLLLMSGSVKVADFGLAKLLERTQVSSSGSMTPAYAAPEFFKGQAGGQSDQYALAVSYCQLRGGRLPFEGNRCCRRPSD